MAILKFLSARAFRIVLLTIFAFGVFHFGEVELEWSYSIWALDNFEIRVGLLAGIIIFALMPTQPWHEREKRWYFWFWALMIIAFTPFLLLKFFMGVNDLGSIFLFFDGNDVGDATGIGVADYLEDVIWQVGISVAVLIAGYILFRNTKFFSVAIMITAVVMLMKHPVTRYFQNMMFPNAAHQLVTFERDFIPPQITRRPQQPKNLILVYLESLERTYFEIEATRAPLQGLIDIADRGVEFTNNVQVYGSHNSIAGLTSTQCGAPMLASSKGDPLLQLVPLEEDFMSSVSCLGDILKDEGYQTSFIFGPDLKWYSQRAFLNTHGYQRMYGFNSYPKEERAEHMIGWGVDDELMFDHAMQELEFLSGEGKPFMFALATMATHQPDGFPDANCEYETEIDSDLPRAMFCTVEHLNALLAKVDELGQADNTVIALMSDHLSAPNIFRGELQSLKRRNFLAFLNVGTSMKNDKLSIPFDVFPTLLEAAGFELKDGRANFGVSLFSDAPSLINQFGEDQAYSVFKGNRALGEALWRSKGAEN